MDFLKVDAVHHTYFTKTSAVTALSDVSLKVEEGEFVSFLGPSGCGKTTLLSIIAGLFEPTEGTVTLEGKRVETAENEIGYIFAARLSFSMEKYRRKYTAGAENRE